MKNIITRKMNKITRLLIALLFCLGSFSSIGQQAPSPPGCPAPNEKGKVGDNGAPLEDSAAIILGMTFLYGVYIFRKSLKNSKEQTLKNNIR